MAIAGFRRRGRDRRRGRGGAALLEAALIPGVAIGAAAVLTPGGLPWLRRNLAPLLKPAKRRPAPVVKPATPAPFGFPIKQALAKTDHLSDHRDGAGL